MVESDLEIGVLSEQMTDSYLTAIVDNDSVSTTGSLLHLAFTSHPFIGDSRQIWFISLY